MLKCDACLKETEAVCKYCGAVLPNLTIREIVDINGWKGKDRIEVIIYDDGYTLKMHRKNKETLKIVTEEHYVPKPSVQTLWQIIRNGVALSDAADEKPPKLKYAQIVKALIQIYHLDTEEGLGADDMLTSFNGGKMRSRHYFPKYYRPCLILEGLRYIKYFGHGSVSRLSDHTEIFKPQSIVGNTITLDRWKK